MTHYAVFWKGGKANLRDASTASSHFSRNSADFCARRELLALARQLDDQLQAQLRKIGDDFRPGREYIAAWGYEIGPHGSVPYNTQDPRPQTPQRTPDAR